MSSRTSERPLRAEFILLKVVDAEQLLRDFGLIVGTGLLSQAVATLFRLPEMVVLVAVEP